MPHKFPKPRKKEIDLEKIKRYLAGLGFQTETVFQQWRHVTAIGCYEGKEAVFKMASTQKTGLLTKNEYYWDRAAWGRAKVPEAYACGEYEKLFWLIAEKFPGEPASAKDADMRKIANLSWDIEEIKVPAGSEWAKYQEKRHQMPIGEKLLESAAEWASQVPENLSQYLKVIENAKNNIQTCVGHGDFTARHIYFLKGEAGVIDGEHAGIAGARYYDPAYFYIRACSDEQAFGKGKEFLQEFLKLLPPEKKDTFWEEIKPVLIQRLVGDLWGAQGQRELIVERLVWGKDILEDKILT